MEKLLKAPVAEEQIKEFFEDSEGTQDLMTDFHNVRYSVDGTEVVKSLVSISVKELFAISAISEAFGAYLIDVILNAFSLMPANAAV